MERLHQDVLINRICLMQTGSQKPENPLSVAYRTSIVSTAVSDLNSMQLEETLLGSKEKVLAKRWK